MEDDLFHRNGASPAELSPYTEVERDSDSACRWKSPLCNVLGTVPSQVAGPRVMRPSWRHLFAFTTQAHAAVLSSALVAAGLTAAIKTFLAVALGKIFGIVADYGLGAKSGPETLDQVSRWCIILVGIGAANWLASSAFLALSVSFGELQAHSIRTKVFDSMVTKEMAWYDSLDQGISSLLVRIQTQTRELQLATSQVLGLLIADIMTSLASLAIAFSYSWKLTFVLLSTLPISILVLALVSRNLEPAIQAQKSHLATASKYVTASLTAIDLVKVFNGYDEDLGKYYGEMKHAGRAYMLQAGFASFQMGYVAFWVIIIFVANFWYGLVLVKQGMPPGHVITTFYATLACFQGIEALMPQWLVLAKGISAGSFLKGLTVDGPSRCNPQAPVSFTPQDCVGVVEMTNVTFCYPSNPDKEVIKRSNYVFPTGEMTFIVGRSGSGKSTLGSLIAGLYRLTSGDILIDGHPLHSLNKDWVSSNVVLIQQSSVLFSGTVFENVALGHRSPGNATREEVLAACEVMLLQSMLSDMPHGLDTMVGTRGEGLSGGQKQRVALARAWLRDPNVLILDEVTSGLDQATRTLVMDAIRIWRAEKTTIVITHDVSQIQPSDFVYVLDDARLVQKGSRRALDADPRGLFATLVDSLPSENSPEHSPMRGIVHARKTHPKSSRVRHSTHTANREDTSRFSVFQNNAKSPAAANVWRTSLGIDTARATSLRVDQLWDQLPTAVHAQSALGSTEIYRASRQRFSEFVRQRFSPFDDTNLGQLDWRPPSSHAIELESIAETMQRDMGSEKTGEASFIFGEAKRRSSVQRSRQAPMSDENGAGEGSDPMKKASASLVSILKTVWPCLGTRDKVTFLCGLGLCFLTAAATPLFSYCFGQLCGVFWSSGDRMAQGRQWAVYMIAIAIVDGLSTAGSRYLMEHAGQAWVHSVRLKALHRILRQPRRWFDEAANSPSRVAECLDRNSEEMRTIVGRLVPLFTIGVVMIIISILWAMTISWKLSLVALSPMPAFIGSVQGYALASGRWETRRNRAAEEASAVFTDAFLNIRVVKALSLQGYFREKYSKLASDTLRVGHRGGLFSCVVFGISQSVNYPVTALAFYYGTVLAVSSKQQISLTQIMLVMNLLLFGIGTAASLFGNIPQLTMAQATATQLLEYSRLEIPPENDPKRGRKLLAPFPVVVQHVSFAYSAGSAEHSLRDVSFSLSLGECTAIVGPSGCGKSTMLSLLMGLYLPTASGSVRFSHMSAEHTNMDYLRRTMGYVSQNPFLFPTTVFGNISYGLEESSPHRLSENVYSAAQAAGVHEFIISLPQGYNTLVGEGGQTLSGGQSQRICIARALVRRPLLLVLDEPTSALDAGSAELVRQTIHRLTRERSVMAIVMATHSKEMMRIADKVVMMQNGVNVEEGRYHELLLARGPFARMINTKELGGADI